MPKFSIAVYGTLLKGCGNHGRLQRSDVSRAFEGKVSGFEMRDLYGYPMIFHTGNPEDKIEVEVYNFDNPEVLRSLDRLEGFVPGSPNNNFYIRIPATVVMEDGTEQNVEIYAASESFEHRKEQYNIIPTGSWRKHMKVGRL